MPPPVLWCISRYRLAVAGQRGCQGGPAVLPAAADVEPLLPEVLDSADEAELEQARPLARTLLIGLAASQIADAFAGCRNASGLAAAEALKDEPMIRIMATAMVISAMRIQELAANLQDVNATLTATILPVEADARKIATMPEAEREARISKLSWPEQRRIRRLISKFDKPRE